MAAPIRLSTSLPPDEQSNGLLGNINTFVTRPGDPVLAVVELGTIRIVRDIALDYQVPVIGIHAIELACRSVSAASLRELMDLARQERIGARGLPFDADLIRGDGL
ncbi:hypothetical protein [Protofrankia coriariae]|uniref:Uncharacterized protein n=1 Tax=Protofrankia coriariae TaxID=1562887 RepID=A0ABR5F4A0_9ACTN|nr:hypothetical protein [Protofrankia coriariae]KLL11556.1 hypothetical protein FrCorBMG51_10980 [Protofrankia coriariae]